MIHLLSFKRLIRTTVLFAILIANIAQAATTQIHAAAIIAECVFTNESSTYSASTLQTFAANGTTAAGIKLTPAGTTGAPASGAHGAGELHVDSAGDFFICQVSGSPGTWAEVGAASGTLTTIQEGGTTVSAVATILDFDGPAFSTTLVGTTVRVSPTFGTTSGTFTEGSDTRHNPAPSGAGKLAYDNGSAYVAASAGASTTVLHGGSTPSFSAIVSADITDGTVTVLDVTSDVSSRLFPPGAVTGDTPYHNGSDWQRLTIGSSAQFSQVNGSSLPSWVTMSGDATIAVGGALTIAANAIGSSEITDGTVTQLDVTSDVSNRLHAPGGVSGDISYSNGTNWLRLALGSASTVLQVSSGGVLQYGTVTSAMITDTTIVAGDLATALSDRLNPSPSGAGKFIYDNGTAYVAGTAGLTSQVLIGGTAPSFGNVPIAAGQEVWALADLSDVTSKSGSGTVVLMQTTPTITTPVLTNPTISNTVTWTDNADAANSTGTQVRNGSALEYHDGTASRELVAKLRAETEASGDLLTHNGTTWLSLVKGSNSTVLNVSSGGVLGYSTITSEMIANGVVSTLDVTTDVSSRLFPSGAVQGDIVYFNGTDWQRLAAGNSGEFLKTLGTGANPLWASASASFSGDVDATTNDYIYNGGSAYGGDVYINDGVGLTGTLNVTGAGVFTSTLTASRALASGTGSVSAPDFADSANTDTGFGIGTGQQALFAGIDAVATPVLSIGDTSNARVLITGGQLAAGGPALKVTGIISTSASPSWQYGELIDVTLSGAYSGIPVGLGVNLGTGSTVAAAWGIDSRCNTVTNGTAPYSYQGNIGVFCEAYGASAMNIGFQAYVANAAKNIGVFAPAVLGAPTTQVGVYGSALGGTNNIAGLFALSATEITYTGKSAALLADNGAVAADIFGAYDNGTKVVSIADGGLLTATAGTSITAGGLSVGGYSTFASDSGIRVSNTANSTGFALRPAASNVGNFVGYMTISPSANDAPSYDEDFPLQVRRDVGALDYSGIKISNVNTAGLTSLRFDSGSSTAYIDNGGSTATAPYGSRLCIQGPSNGIGMMSVTNWYTGATSVCKVDTGTGGILSIGAPASTAVGVINIANIPSGNYVSEWMEPGNPPSPLTGLSNGSRWVTTTQQCFSMWNAGMAQTLPGVMFTQTGDVTVTNSTFETSMIGTTVGVTATGTNGAAIGKTLEFDINGIYSSDAATPGNMTFNVYMDTLVVATTDAIAIPTSAAGKPWRCHGKLVFLSTGTAQMGVFAQLDYMLGTTNVQQTVPLRATGVSVPGATSQDFDVRVACDTADTDNSFVGRPGGNVVIKN